MAIEIESAASDSRDPDTRGFEIAVNSTHFRELHPTRTGLGIKEDAIAAGARIKTSYVLDEETDEGPRRVNDDTVVSIKSGLRFKAHPGGSDS